MSDYSRGKDRVRAWANHWSDVVEFAGSGSTIEAKMIEYGTSIRAAFHTPSEPNILIMSPWIKVTHREIMELPVEQREAILVWHFGDEGQRREMFGKTVREPGSMLAIYQKLGRYHRSAQKKQWSGKNLPPK